MDKLEEAIIILNQRFKNVKTVELKKFQEQVQQLVTEMHELRKRAPKENVTALFNAKKTF